MDFKWLNLCDDCATPWDRKRKFVLKPDPGTLCDMAAKHGGNTAKERPLAVIAVRQEQLGVVSGPVSTR